MTRSPVFPYPFLSSLSAGNWRHLAACAGADGEIFFSDDQAASSGAQRLCDACPVVRECGAYAEEAPERFGVWGGMTARQRGWNPAGVRNRGRRGEAA
ncbi:WhiB family transcriptional regulator [Streptomyces sp. NPDC008121]|uniref:WhiB family transcriptional regulator n=1 Tax=Streptomyces sp. NPDC008121 TaxID=3364809 RepID=UPI0036E4D977